MNKRILLVVAAIIVLAPASWAQLGTFFGADCTAFYGEAVDPNNPGNTLSINLYYQLGTGPWTFLETVVANQGDGHGFRYPFPLAFEDGQTRNFEATFMNGAPFYGWIGGPSLTCSSNYHYYAFDGLTAAAPSKWSQNGSTSPGGTGLTAAGSSGGSWISTLAVPDGTNEYEVRMTLNLTASGGTYAAYLRASPDAMSGPSAQGTYYSVELQNPTFVGSACTATLAINKRQSGTITLLGSTLVPCHTDSILRAVRTTQKVTVWLDGVDYLTITDASIASGKPGIGGWGMPSSNSIARVDLGPLDRIAPSPVNTASVAISAVPNRVDLSWDPALDDANGTGAALYSLYRNSVLVATISGTEYTDEAVSAGTTYTYKVYAQDYHLNAETTGATFSVTTPAAGAVDPRRVGLRPTSTTWGGGGEEIDTLSGNLNFTLPLLKAMGRGGWGVAFALSYNSQIWRQQGGKDWKLGHDIGYGVGWRLQAGSITPYWSGGVIDHYTFVDSTGAEYRLNVNSSGRWTSQEGIYILYKPANYRLYFPDGSFWVMGAVSAGTEQDSGTRYPTVMEDTNGNQILIHYQAGAGAPWADSSSRITTIEDVRAKQQPSGWQDNGPVLTYQFTYSSGAFPHLSGITSGIGTAENYSFTYASQNLYSPFATSYFGGTALLSQVMVTGLGIGHSMTYNPVSGAGVTQPATSGELTQVIMPNLGWLRWAYRTFTYPGNHSLREVQSRYLAKSATSGETAYTFVHDDSGSSQVHAWTTLGDPTGTGKYWSFFTDTSQWTAGLVSTFEDRLTPSGTAVRRRAYTWTQGPAGDPYISAVLLTADPGASYQKQSKTTQVVDGYGNVTQTLLYDYPSLTTPARTYTNTYLSGSGYSSANILNRLLTSTVSDGTNTTTLVSNTFDSYYYPWVVGIATVTGAREHDLTYDGSVTTRGNVTSSVGLGVTNLMAYDTTGTVVETYDALGRTVAAAYSSATNNAAPDALTPNVNSNLSTSYTYTSFLGLASVTGPNAANSTIAYDSYGRPTSSTSPHGAVTTYAYTYNPTTVTATTGTRVVTTTLDGLGRTIQVATGDTSGVQSVVDTVYDSCACSPLGKVKQVSLPHAPGATVYWTTYSYDALGRTVTATKADGSVTSYLYQGNCTTITDPAGKWKTYTSDAMGNLTLVSEPAPGGGTHQTTYTYNLLNKLTGVSMPRGSVTQTRTFNYDLTTGRLMSATNPETGTVSYTYRADGSLASKTDAKNQQTTYTYDGYGRLTSAAGYTYYYDSNPLDSTYPSNYGWGRLTAVAWTSASMGMNFTEMYRYSVGGLMTGKRVLVSPNPDPSGGKNAVPQNLDSVFTYDTEGHYLGPQSYPEWPQTFGYSQDTLGRPTGIWANPMNPGDNARMVVQDVIYGVAGELQQARIFKEPPMYTYVQSYLRQNWTYNTLFQATRETSVDEEGWISTTVVDLQYSYTAGQNNGRIAQRTEAVSGEQVNYTYDSLNRLIAAVTTGPQYGLSWTYDGFGNMTSQQVTMGSGYNNNLSYNGLTNRITTPGYGYDANGNLTAMPALTMQYDMQNRMVSSTPSGGGTTTVYAYGPGGQRVGQSYAPDPNNWQNNMWSIYVYGPDGRRIADCRAGYAPLNPQYPQMNLVFQTSCQTAYVHFRGRLVRMESPPLMQNGVWVDQRGVTMGTDRLGSVHYWENTATTNYYPYGEEETPTWNDKQKFATYTRDSATGLDYAQHRYYASQIGRFTTADPYRASAKRANPQSWNRYAYVQNDPVNANDPSGLDCDFVGAGGLTIGDPGSGCGGPSIGWGDDDPAASVNSCQSAAMFGIDGCGKKQSDVSTLPLSPPPCMSLILDFPDPTIVERLMNENSWGIVGDVPSLYTEDLWIMSALDNRVSTPWYDQPRDSSGNPVANTLHNQALYANGPGRPTSMSQGIALYNAALFSPSGSSLCDDLTYAINAVNTVLSSGPVNSQVLSWFGVYGGNAPPSFYPAPLSQVNDTVFFGYFTYPRVPRKQHP